MKWYCLRSQLKHEHIAAAHLRREAGMEVCLPRIRFRRATRDGPVWCTEALFPNYLFARFDLNISLRHVQHIHGVQGIIRFGSFYPPVPDEVLRTLRSSLGSDGLHLIDEELAPGAAVVISGGAFNNFHAVVSRVMPAQARVAVLLDFLGRQIKVELPMAALLCETPARERI
jgi:transcriptional antiterminator RfaH